MDAQSFRETASASKERLNVLVLCHFGRTGYNILRALNALRAHPYFIIDSRSDSLRYSHTAEIVLQVEQLSQADPDVLVKQINDLHSRVGLDTVMASDVDGLTILGKIRHRLAAPVFPMADLQTLELLDNKWEFWNLCQAQAVTTPKTLFFAAKSDLDPDLIGERLAYPSIVKPAAGYGQRGIVKFNTPEDVIALRDGPEEYNQHGLIVQEYIEGTDWAISIFARDGKIEHWTTWDCPSQLESGYGISRFLTTQFHGRTDLYDMASRIIAATKFSGVANFDTRFDDRARQMTMFECNPRFFGRLAAARLCGLDFVRAGLPGFPRQQECLDHGYYYPWQELFTRRAFGHFASGRWRLNRLVRDLYELFLVDPVPPVMRKLHHEDQQA